MGEPETEPEPATEPATEPVTATASKPEAGQGQGRGQGPETEPESETGRATLWGRLQRLIPVGSLVLGVIGAVMMDRGPEQGVLVAWATLGAWLALLAVQLLGPSSDDDPAAPPWWRRLLHYSSVMVTQSIVQLQLFFALPFFVRATALDPGHLVFMAGLLGLCAVSLWDPWFEATLASRWRSPILPAAGTFVVLVAVLPGAGLSTGVSLWLSALAAAAGAPLVMAASVPRDRRRLAALVASAFGMLLPLSLYLGGARLVPAAPLRLAAAEFGTRVQDKWVTDPRDRFDTVPPQLVCATAIASPVGVHDRLYHRWTHDGRELARIELDIVGGRADGYRTRSRIRHFGKHPAGRYTCRVETAAGQVLGSLSTTIDAP